MENSASAKALINETASWIEQILLDFFEYIARPFMFLV